MVKHPERQQCIRDLNSAAKQCGVQGVYDGSGRPKVLDLLERIRQSAGPEAAKTSAESTWTKYEASFAQPAATQDEQMCSKTGEGDSLVRLGKRLHTRCDQLIKLKGERIPK